MRNSENAELFEYTPSLDDVDLPEMYEDFQRQGVKASDIDEEDRDGYTKYLQANGGEALI